MFDERLLWPVETVKLGPLLVRRLQQAIGGIEGEIRARVLCFFQAWGARSPSTEHRDMLLHTATGEIGHIEMLASAVAPNRDKTPVSAQQAGAATASSAPSWAATPRPGASSTACCGGTSCRAARPAKSDGVPSDLSHIYASGNLTADMCRNATAKSTGRVLTCRRLDVTSGTGMRETLAFNVARDAMGQQQWLGVIEVGRHERGLHRSPPRADRRRASR